MGKRLILAIFLIAIIPVHTWQFISAQSEAPYLYYYSSQDGAFIIESADGSDRREFFQYELPDDYELMGPGWSSSNELHGSHNWFSWYSISSNQNRSEIHVIDKTAVKHFEFTIDGLVTSASWKNDFLLVNATETSGLTAYIFDVENEFALVDRYESNLAWVSYSDYEIESADPERVSYFLPLPDMSGSTILNASWDNLILITQIESGVKVQDVIKDLEFSEAINGTLVKVSWAVSNRNALLYFQNTAENSFEVWLLAVDRQELNFLSRSNNQLPTSAFLGTPTDFDQGLVWFQDSLRRWNWLELWNGEVSELAIWEDADVINVQWLPNAGKLAAIIHSSDNRIDIYMQDIGSTEFKLYASIENIPAVYKATFTPNENALLFYGNLTASDPSMGIYIYDFASRQLKPIQEEMPILPIGIDLRWRWNEIEQWFMAIYESGEQYFISVGNENGTQYRDVTSCAVNSYACFGWMP